MSTPDEDLARAEREHQANPTPDNYTRLLTAQVRCGVVRPEALERHLNRHKLKVLLVEGNTHVTKEIAVLAGAVGYVSFWTGNHLGGTVQEWRVNGKCKTWVSEPSHFKLPVKQGWNTHSYITDRNCMEFSLRPPVLPLLIAVRRVYLDRGGYVKENVLGLEKGRYFGSGVKLWAFEVSRLDGDLPEAPGDMNNPFVQGFYHKRSDNRDSIRSEIRDHYAKLGFAVHFTA